MREFWEILGKYSILDVKSVGSKGLYIRTNYGPTMGHNLTGYLGMHSLSL